MVDFTEEQYQEVKNVFKLLCDIPRLEDFLMKLNEEQRDKLYTLDHDGQLGVLPWGVKRWV